jgi:cytochrome c oxidase subunit 2
MERCARTRCRSRQVLPAAAAHALLPLATLGLSGCEAAQSIFHTSGPAAHQIAVLSWSMVILFVVITGIMWALFAFAFYRRRGTLEEHEPIDLSGGEGWIAIGGLIIPCAILTVLFVFGLQLLADYPINPMKAPRPAMENMKPEIQIIGHQWWWEIHYLNDNPSLEVITADELHLPVGRPVNIEVATADVMHSFWIPALHGKVDMIPGQKNFIRVEASQAGEFSGQCAEYCGDEHARMRLLAIAQEPAEYQMWLKSQRQPGHEPTTPEAIAGKQVFLNAPCAFCHEVRGTTAGGTVAPDLTHIGSRKMIASNIYPNNAGYLEAWITHAQSLKPDCLMPNLTQFSGEQLQQMVAYLRQLQ